MIHGPEGSTKPLSYTRERGIIDELFLASYSKASSFGESCLCKLDDVK